MERILALSSVSPLMHWAYTGACIVSEVSSWPWELGAVVVPRTVIVSAAPSCFSLLGENTKAIGRYCLPSTCSQKLLLLEMCLLWVHPQPVSKPDGLTLRCSIIDLLIIWYLEAKRVMMNLSHQHIWIQQGVVVLGWSYLTVVTPGIRVFGF